MIISINYRLETPISLTGRRTKRRQQHLDIQGATLWNEPENCLNNKVRTICTDSDNEIRGGLNSIVRVRLVFVKDCVVT